DDQRKFHGSLHLYWSPDGTEVFSEAAGRGSTLIYAVPSEGGNPRAIVEGQRRVYGFSTDRERRQMALAISDPSTPGDLFVQDVGGRPTQLTQSTLSYSETSSWRDPKSSASR